MVSEILIGLLLGFQANPGPDTSAGQTVQLITSKPKSCISITSDQVFFIVFDRKELERMAIPRPTDWKTEAQRMQLIRSNRAQELFKSLSEKRDDLNCQIVENPGDGIFLVLDFINRGHGRVWDSSTRSFLPQVKRIEENQYCLDGFRKPGGRPFIAIEVCVP